MIDKMMEKIEELESREESLSDEESEQLAFYREKITDWFSDVEPLY